jgi:hypothetical protein
MITSEQLDNIEEFASNFMTWRQIAILVDIPDNELKEKLLDKNSQIYIRYTKGKTKSILEINKRLVKLAKLGSPQAELLVKDDINKQLSAENDL